MSTAGSCQSGINLLNLDAVFLYEFGCLAI